MSEATVNNEIKISYSEGYSVMDAEMTSKYFTNTENRWSIKNEENHSIVSIGWNKVNAFMAFLADEKGAANGMHARMSGSLRDYVRGADISRDVCGKKGVGFDFTYASTEEGIPMEGSIIVFRNGKTFYFIYFIVRTGFSEIARKELASMIGTMSFVQ